MEKSEMDRLEDRMKTAERTLTVLKDAQDDVMRMAVRHAEGVAGEALATADDLAALAARVKKLEDGAGAVHKDVPKPAAHK